MNWLFSNELKIQLSFEICLTIKVILILCNHTKFYYKYNFTVCKKVEKFLVDKSMISSTTVYLILFESMINKFNSIWTNRNKTADSLVPLVHFVTKLLVFAEHSYAFAANSLSFLLIRYQKRYFDN